MGDSAVMLGRARDAGVAFVDEQTPADVVVDALFGTGFRGKPRPDADAGDRRGERGRRAGRRGRSALGRRCLDGQGRGRGRAGERDGHVPRAQGRPRRRARPVSRGRDRRRGHRPCAGTDAHAPRQPGGSRPRAAPHGARQQVLGGLGARRGRVARPDRRALAHLRGRASRGRGDRHRLRARVAEPRLRAAAGRGDDQAVPGRGRRP